MPKQRLADRQVEEIKAIRQLEILAGRYPSGTMLVATKLSEVINDVPAGIPMNLLERCPDLLSAKSKLLSAAYSTQAAEKALLPSFALTGVSSKSSESLSNLLRFDQVFFGI